MPSPVQPNPLAVAAIAAKTPIGTPLKSADIQQYVPLGLRTSAQLSATVESLRFTQSVQDRVQNTIEMLRREMDNGGEGAFQTRDRFIQELQDIAREEGLTPEDESLIGGLQDPTSERRLGLIYDMQVEQAQGAARYKMDQDADVLDAFPAYEFTRVESRDHPRDEEVANYWENRWKDAGGEIYGGRMIALKTSPVWEKLSRFGTPWPPFDYGSGMGLVDVSREECEKLGLLEPGETIEPSADQFEATVQASVRDLSPKMQDALKTIFGDQVEIDDGVAKWTGDGS